MESFQGANQDRDLKCFPTFKRKGYPSWVQSSLRSLSHTHQSPTPRERGGGCRIGETDFPIKEKRKNLQVNFTLFLTNSEMEVSHRSTKVNQLTSTRKSESHPTIVSCIVPVYESLSLTVSPAVYRDGSPICTGGCFGKVGL